MTLKKKTRKPGSGRPSLNLPKRPTVRFTESEMIVLSAAAAMNNRSVNAEIRFRCFRKEDVSGS